MSTLSLAEINAAVEAAYATAAATPTLVAAHSIGENVTLRTDVYEGPKGTGFAVIATVELGWKSFVIAKQSGPETWREQASPSLAELVAEARKARAARYDAEASVCDLADAETKMSSTDATVQAAGAAQKVAVLAKRLEIKTAIPLPT